MTKTLSKKIQGEETRATLIKTGARLFAQQGYSGVSMRPLAAEAGVNLATVSYHFGGKAGLYEAIIQEIINVRDELFPSSEEVEEHMLKAGSDKDAQGLAVDWFVAKLTHNLLAGEDYTWPAVIISRELAHPSDLYPKMEKEFFDPTFHALRTLVQGTQPADITKEELIITSQCVIGIIIKFLEGRVILHKRLEWDSYHANIDTLTTILQKRIRGLLGLPMETV